MVTIGKAIEEAMSVQCAAFDGMLKAKTHEDRTLAYMMWVEACEEAQTLEDIYLASKRP